MLPPVPFQKGAFRSMGWEMGQRGRGGGRALTPMLTPHLGTHSSVEHLGTWLTTCTSLE